MRTSAVQTFVPSFTPPLIAVCEWQSISPGVRCLPVPSMMWAFDGAVRFLPTAAILPSTTSTSVLGKGFSCAIVHTVALRMSQVLCSSAGGGIIGVSLTRGRVGVSSDALACSVRWSGCSRGVSWRGGTPAVRWSVHSASQACASWSWLCMWVSVLPCA